MDFSKWSVFVNWATSKTSLFHRVAIHTGAEAGRNPQVHSRNEIKRFGAVDASGRHYVVLEIVPLERVQTYHGLRVERGKPRYELNDGTPVIRRDGLTYEVADTRVNLKISAGSAGL